MRSRGAAVFALLAAFGSTQCGNGRSAPSEERARATSQAVVAWTLAKTPIHIRKQHTATLVGTGEVLLAGGGAAPGTTELLDPYRHESRLGPALVTPRTGHTATMLLSGRVLLAGGGTATAELYDPIARTTTATGSMTKPRTGHTAVRLRSGKVLVTGAAMGDASAEIYDPAAGTWTATSPRTTSGTATVATLPTGDVVLIDADSATGVPHVERFAPASGTWTSIAVTPPSRIGPTAMTTLRDGRVLLAPTDGCASTGGPPTCFSHVEIFDPFANAGAGSLTKGPDFSVGRLMPSTGVALLPDGSVLYAGGSDEAVVLEAERFVGTGAAKLADDGPTSTGHGAATAVMLPGGDVLVAGGAQASSDRRVYLPTWRAAAGKLIVGRLDHGNARLHDGNVLVAGGASSAGAVLASAEVFDAVAETFSSVGSMTAARVHPTMTTLRSGKVLVAGGTNGSATLASAELYDPAAAVGMRFTATPPMGTPRGGHTATLLPDGRVLVTGGCNNAACATTELYDPTANAFSAGPAMTAARTNHGAVLLRSGKVLVVGDGGGTAELYDPAANAFRATTSPGAVRDGRTAVALPDGRVMVSGNGTLASDVFDPATETWSFTPPAAPPAATGTDYIPMVDGRVAVVGGTTGGDGVQLEAFVFDPLASDTGSFVLTASGPTNYFGRPGIVTGTGAVLLAGGLPCIVCPPLPMQDVTVSDDGAPLSARPVIASAPSSVTPGAKVVVTGSGFANVSEGSNGWQSASPSNQPSILWVSDANGSVVAGTVLDFTDTTATWLVPATGLRGHGMLFVSVGGVLSRSASVSIDAAPPALACAFDVECGTGFCTDGVCCDRRCDGKCEGCSKARKGSGDDGVCGAVPPGHDPAGRCFSQRGQTCGAPEECATGFCAQGVCCDSSCTGECQSCNQQDHLGICSPIQGGACGATCDGAHTLKKVGAPDTDCTPYACEADHCKTTCASARDCVAPAICNGTGACVPPFDPTTATDSVCGCRVVGSGGRSRGAGAGIAIAIALALLAARRRRS